MQEFVGLGPNCYAFPCTGKVGRNVLLHVGHVGEEDSKGCQAQSEGTITWILHITCTHCGASSLIFVSRI